MNPERLVCGIHAVNAALTRDGHVAELWVDSGRRNDARLRSLIDVATTQVIPLHFVALAEVDRLATNLRHQGVVGRINSAPVYSEHDLERLIEQHGKTLLLLVLDGVQDPHNLGACLRTADAAGVHAVIAPRDRATGLTAAVRKVACGGAESVPFIQVTNLARTLRYCKDKGVWLVGASGEADMEVYEADLQGPIGLVLGAEESGLRRLTKEHCDSLVRIPMLGQVESLNVSVATGICLYEVLRQRQVAGGDRKK